MTKSIGWLAIGGIFGLVAAAHAQTPAPSIATTAFDGTYTPISSTPENYEGLANGDPYLKARFQCRDTRPEPLIIERGQARLSNATTGNFEGTVGPQGELVMRLISLAAWPEGVMPGNEIILSVRIDRNGTARGRRVSRACAYDFVWQKAR
jgi:hypothetical protein